MAAGSCHPALSAAWSSKAMCRRSNVADHAQRNNSGVETVALPGSKHTSNEVPCAVLLFTCCNNRPIKSTWACWQWRLRWQLPACGLLVRRLQRWRLLAMLVHIKESRKLHAHVHECNCVRCLCQGSFCASRVGICGRSQAYVCAMN